MILKKLLNNNLCSIGIGSFAFLYPLGTFLQSIGMLILIATISVLLFKSEKTVKQINPYLFSIPFIIYLLFWPFAYDRIEAGNFLLRSLPILVVPILILKSHKLLDLRIFKLFFVYGTITMILFCLLMGFIHSMNGNFIIDNFTYYQFASYVSLHPTYTALIVLCALIFLNYNQLIKSSILYVVFSLLFVSTLFLLQIRSAIFLLAILSLIKIALELKERNFRKVVFVICILSVITFSVIKQKRFATLFNSELNNKLGTDEDNGITQRIWLWQTSLNDVRNNPMFGFGLRSQRSLFYKRAHKMLLAERLPYRERISKLLNAKKNLHNQYLQWLYDFGFFGFLILVTFILALFLLGLKNKNFLFLTLITVFATMMITENLMDRQSGLYFYAVVLPLVFSKKT
jgi:O-antigen ligase